jgi:uncharacterized protein YndB with AHSA1/START domain
MKKIHTSIEIKCTQAEVWDAIVNNEKYRLWTATFSPGSHFKGGWNKGDKILFLGPGEDGAVSGIVSEIAKSIYPSYISIQHNSYITNGVEDTTSEAVRAWFPAYENYSIEKIDDTTTRFTVDMDSEDQYYEMFLELWPKAVQVLKEVVEKYNSVPEHKVQLKVVTSVNAPIDMVWEMWNNPEHMVHWAFASEDWCCPKAINDLEVGKKFVTTMSARDQSTSFDFSGTYTEIRTHEYILYHTDDNRDVSITFSVDTNADNGNIVCIEEVFEAETQNTLDLQVSGWQAILNNFKTYVESQNK